QAVPSTVHGMLKFPVERGIITIYSTILIPAECTSVITSPVIHREVKTRPANFKIALHPDFPDQEVVIGGTLSDKGRTELYSVLRKNFDIFAWQPSDMMGVPRSVAKHRLNIREGYSPVRQKKRGQAPERAKAIQAKVQKLVEVGIMREVYYHDWLSNPVMMLIKAITKYSWQKQTKKRQPSIQDRGRNIEVYVDDFVIKSHTEAEMMRDVEETFRTLRKGAKFTYTLRFQFTASNNEAEYEALVTGLRIAARMGVKNVQVHRPVTRHPQQHLTPITAPCPFYKWGIDIAGPFFGRTREGKKFNSRHGLLHEVDRSKGSGNNYGWTGEEIRMRYIVCCFGISREIISDNGKQFSDNPLKDWVRGVAFQPDDFVYRSNDASHAVAGGKLGPKWEGPYEVIEALGDGAYKLRSIDGTILPKMWNIANLKRCGDGVTVAPEVRTRGKAAEEVRCSSGSPGQKNSSPRAGDKKPRSTAGVRGRYKEGRERHEYEAEPTIGRYACPFLRSSGEQRASISAGCYPTSADPPVATKSRKRGRDGADVNAPPKVLRRDHANPQPTGSTHGGKSLAAIQLGLASTCPVHVPKNASAGVSDLDPLSFVDPQSRHPADIA
nr:reverse transcriptase domain-containing protein [Tanacetum cinerariifolium]